MRQPRSSVTHSPLPRRTVCWCVVARAYGQSLTPVQVHCLMGISRSATVVCAYLVATTDMTAAQALAAVQAKRAVVNPNYGFQRQLRKYAAQCHGESDPALAGPGTGSGLTVAERIRLLSGKEDAAVSVAAAAASTRNTGTSTSSTTSLT